MRTEARGERREGHAVETLHGNVSLGRRRDSAKVEVRRLKV